ncbi:hypothetical protein [Natronolimnobius baerhuensis]|uniref:Acetyl-CoA synthetase n=1 Tax=Natronolimnobius baerhuensis TaxID=253108 RepID=A0A202E8D8_9EURY|nr:hypothetical protein [Natronolimnobius baerhuensis]OVE84408.1 hypothetical protein B2G88_08330 [Natronolimnobius baerhuensis]
MTAATVDELFTRERRERWGDRTTLVDATGREYDHHWLCTTAWKAGNFLRHSGVRNGVTVGVVGTGPLALLAFFGATLLEARTRFDPPTDLAGDDSFRALVAPVEDLESGTYDLPVGAQRIGYGDKPEQPDIHNFNGGLWSENPSFPPVSIDPETALVTDGQRSVSHSEAIAAAQHVIDDNSLERGDRIVVRTPLSDCRTVVAGVLAPLLAEGTIVLGADDADELGKYAVTTSDGDVASVPEAEHIVLEDISLA